MIIKTNGISELVKSISCGKRPKRYQFSLVAVLQFSCVMGFRFPGATLSLLARSLYSCFLFYLPNGTLFTCMSLKQKNAAPIWNPYSKTLINQIEKVQQVHGSPLELLKMVEPRILNYLDMKLQ